MKFTVSESKLDGVIFSIIILACILVMPWLVYFIITDNGQVMARIISFILFSLGLIWIVQMMIVPAMKAFYDHIDIDGEMMTVYQLFTKPMTINCHDWDEIHYKIHSNYGISTSLEFFYEKHYKKEKYRPVYRTGCKNYDELLLYLKKNNVELIERM